MGDWRSWQDREDTYGWSGPRPVTDGIKAKTTRGAPGASWWSKRWVRTLESLGMGPRLARGRSYARLGQVRSLDVQAGTVKARVQGSRPQPYSITIWLQPLSDQEWERVIEVMASQAVFAAKLLAGEMPTNIEDAFRAASVPLFPTTEHDLRTDCSCPDWVNPCKHIAAVYYILAEHFDEDPFLIFKLRGRTRDEIIEALRAKRAAAPGAETVQDDVAREDEALQEAAPLRLEDHMADFWQAGDALETFQVHPARPEVELAILKRLGPAPYIVDKQNLAEYLARAYQAVDAAVAQRLNQADGQSFSS